jgi:hypothetical protein
LLLDLRDQRGNVLAFRVDDALTRLWPTCHGGSA